MTFRLDSRLFKADNELEEKSLIKEEDFTGRPCVVQFACCFTGSVPGYGTFGKVSVSQPVDNSIESQCMFSFNLDKVSLISAKFYQGILLPAAGGGGGGGGGDK